jgi:Dullard-like phosphatase family protein
MESTLGLNKSKAPTTSKISTPHCSKNPFFTHNGIMLKSMTEHYLLSHSGDSDDFLELKLINSTNNLEESKANEEDDDYSYLEIKKVYDNLPKSFLTSFYNIIQIQKISLSKLGYRDAISLPKYHKKCVFLDLDETIIRSTLLKPDTKFKCKMNFKIIQGYAVIKRPYLDEFLDEISKHYDVYIYTSSTEPYASMIIDYINEDKQFIRGFYSRSECILLNGFHVKDLRMCGRSLSDVIMIDNSIEAFSLQTDNGIYIQPFFGENSSDDELLSVRNFLLKNVGCIDTRSVIKSTFCLSTLIRFCKNAKEEL